MQRRSRPIHIAIPKSEAAWVTSGASFSDCVWLYGRLGPMIAKKTLLTCIKPFYRKVHNRTFLLAAATCVAGSLLASSGAWAREPTDDVAVAVLEQNTALDSIYQQPEPAQPASSELRFALPEPIQPESTLGINLEEVRDLASIFDEARKQAQVEYLAEKLRQSPQTMQRYVELAWKEASRRVGLDPGLIIAIMHKESVFRPKVQSSYGAQGLMQVVRRWHREKLHASESLFDPAVNIRVGTDILEEYLELADGDLSKALAKYSGNAAGYAKTVINESRRLAQVADLATARAAIDPALYEPSSAGDAG